MDNVIVYDFIPLPYYDTEDGQWKPSVKVLINGQFDRWTVYDLGFDEARFTMPYARDFAKHEAAWHEETIKAFKRDHNWLT